MSMKPGAPTASAKRARSRIAKAAAGPWAPLMRSRSSGESSRDMGRHAIGARRARSMCMAGRAVLARRLGGSERSMPLLAIGARLRAICLALPEAHEEPMRRGPSYRVGDKIFAVERPWGEWLSLWCKVPDGAREIIIDSDP